ncbi:MAG: 2-hydroxyacid dehydrogenase [Agriterribacter sp.]
MKIIFFSTQPYDKTFFNRYKDDYGFDLEYFDTHLGPHIVNVIDKADAVCAFVNDKVNEEVIKVLAQKGVKIIAMRCAGFNNVDVEAAKKYNIRVCRVPAYSPEAVAEHALAMILTLNRKTHKAYNRVREQNFSLNGLLGFNLYQKTVGVIGTGNIGKAFCRIMLGLGCRVIAHDVYEDKEMQERGVVYQSMDALLQASDIVSLHCPLTEQTKHLINADAISKMKRGVMLINTSRGKLVNTTDAIHALKSGHLGYLGIDVYEQEEKLFFKDLSGSIIEDDAIQRLMSFPNVLVTAHQAFFTEEALTQIAVTTLQNVQQLLNNTMPANSNAVVV